MVWGDTDGDGEVVVSAKLVVDKDAFQQKTGQAGERRRHPPAPGKADPGHQCRPAVVQEHPPVCVQFPGDGQDHNAENSPADRNRQDRRPDAGNQLKWRELTGRNLDSLSGDADGIPTAKSAADRQERSDDRMQDSGVRHFAFIINPVAGKRHSA